MDDMQDRQIAGVLVARPNELAGFDIRLLRGPARIVGEVVRDMQSRDIAVDLPTVYARLNETGMSAKIGSIAWLAEVTINPLLPSSAKHVAGYLSRRDVWAEVKTLANELARSTQQQYGQETTELDEALTKLKTATESLCARASGAEIDSLPFGMLDADALLAPIGSMDEHYPPYMSALLRGGMVSILTAPSKAGKSFLAESIALHAAAGVNFVGFEFNEATSVLVVDWELRRLELLERFNRLADAYGMKMPKNIGYISMKEYRGDQDIISKRRAIEDAAKRMGAKIIIMDCLYMMKPAESDENSNSDMGVVVREIDRMAVDTNAAILVVHHQGKGDKSGTSTMDSGAGAGVVSRLVSCAVIAMKQHKKEDCWSLFWSGRQMREGKRVIQRVHYSYAVRDDLEADELKTAMNATMAKVQKSVEMGPDEFAEKYCSGTVSREMAKTDAVKDGISLASADRLFRAALDSGLLKIVRESARGCAAMYSSDLNAEEQDTPGKAARKYFEEHQDTDPSEIAKMFGVSLRTVYNIIREVKG